MCEVLPGRFRPESEAQLRRLGYRFAWIRGAELVPTDRIAGDPSYRWPNYWFSVKL